MFSYINSALVVTLGDGRTMRGTFIAYDKHMNLVLSGVTETRASAKKIAVNGEIVRELGLVLVRGEHVVSIRAEKKAAAVGADVPAGPGVASVVPGGRGAPIPALPGKKSRIQ
jgi:small nuclear ribonucleoprotein B and B'